VKTV
jgi:hypothetical protein